MAICTLEAGSIQIAQLSGQAPIVKSSLVGLVPDTEYKLVIREFGKTGIGCDKGGEEFNPLKETYQGVQNPHQDPKRGRIHSFTTDNSGAATLWQDKLEQNLSGPETIMAKSLTLSKVDADKTETIVDCCIIG